MLYILRSTFITSFPNMHWHTETEKKNPPSAGSSYSNPAHVDLFSDENVDPVYQAKSHVLNQAIQEIGMGKYQVSFRINLHILGRFLNLSAVVSVCTGRFWLGCVRCSLNAYVQPHSEHFFQ